MKNYTVNDLTKAELIEYLRSRLAIPSQRELCFIISQQMHAQAQVLNEKARKLYHTPIENMSLAISNQAQSIQEKAWEMNDEASALWEHAMSLPFRDEGES